MADEEVIREQMKETRTNLTEKLEALEQKVEQTVMETKAAVTETVIDTKEAVTDTVATVKETMHEGVETVKDFMDVKAHVQRHPWLMVGGSIVAGYLLGSLLAERQPPPRRPMPRPLHTNGGLRRKTEPEEPSAVSSLLSTFEPQIEKLKGLAVGAALGAVREIVASKTSPEIGERLRTVIDDVTRKVGGETLPSSEFAGLTASHPSREPIGEEWRESEDLPRW